MGMGEARGSGAGLLGGGTAAPLLRAGPALLPAAGTVGQGHAPWLCGATHLCVNAKEGKKPQRGVVGSKNPKYDL